MRIINALALAWGLACGVLAGTVVPAAAQEDCTPGPNALGVSRVAEIDTTKGPRFGFQYKEQDILADGEVVLTFDDGPLRSHTKHVLEALQAHCTKATFFVVGRMAVADPEMVREYARLGHTVGIHTWSHANLHSITPLKARMEIELGFSAVQQALGKPVAPFFRFPYLADSKSMTIHLQERNIAIFSIDIDSKDYRTRNGESVHHKVMADLARAKKGIILFHDIQPSTARAIPAPAGGSEGQGLPRRASEAEGGCHDHAGVRRHRPARARPAAGHRLVRAAGQALPDLAAHWRPCGAGRGEGAGTAAAPRPARLQERLVRHRLSLVGACRGVRPSGSDTKTPTRATVPAGAVGSRYQTRRV